VTSKPERRLHNRIVLALAVGLWSVAPAMAHEIPSDVRLQVFIKPEPQRLRVLVRAPLEAMRDIDFPVLEGGYLDFDNAGVALNDAARLWLVNEFSIFADDERLTKPNLVATRASLPSDRSFAAYDTALLHTQSAPLATGTPLVWQQAVLDVLYEFPLRSTDAAFAIEPAALNRLGQHVVTVLHFLPRSGAERILEVGAQSKRIALDPSWHQAARLFLQQGFEHILSGPDHLLFLLCLVIPFRRRLSALVWTVTAFTAAHSATLAMSAYGLAPTALWFGPLIETLIAASIFYMALENIVGARLRLRWLMAFGFGLVHGFGFAMVLRDTLQFAGTHLLTALLAFNVGVELGQIAVLLVSIPLLNVLFHYVFEQRMGTIILCALIAHTAWHWMSERFAVLRAFHVSADDFAHFTSAPATWALAGALLILCLAAVLAGSGFASRRALTRTTAHRQ
jgi:HupE / UreJ protein